MVSISKSIRFLNVVDQAVQKVTLKYPLLYNQIVSEKKNRKKRGAIYDRKQSIFGRILWGSLHNFGKELYFKKFLSLHYTLANMNSQVTKIFPHFISTIVIFLENPPILAVSARYMWRFYIIDFAIHIFKFFFECICLIIDFQHKKFSCLMCFAQDSELKYECCSYRVVRSSSKND